jgi:hypothetical protein
MRKRERKVKNKRTCCFVGVAIAAAVAAVVNDDDDDIWGTDSLTHSLTHSLTN